MAANKNIVRVAQPIMRELIRGEKGFLAGLMPGDFFWSGSRVVLGPTLTVNLVSQETLYFKTSADRAKLDVLTYDELPTEAKQFTFDKFHTKFEFMSSIITEHRQYKFQLPGKSRVYMMTTGLHSECVQKLDDKKEAAKVHFRSCRKTASFGTGKNRTEQIWFTIDCDILS